MIVKTSTDLAESVPEYSSVSIGKDRSSLSLVDKDLNTTDVCTAFGHFVKFTVTLSPWMIKKYIWNHDAKSALSQQSNSP